MLDACSMLGFECSVCSMLKYLMLGDARARKCSQMSARTRSMLGKSMLDPTLKEAFIEVYGAMIFFFFLKFVLSAADRKSKLK